MIDIQTDTLIPLAAVPGLIPPSARGGPVHVSVIYRWVQKGLKGIRLEAVQIGGRRMTTREALNRFVASQSVAAGLFQGDCAIRTPARRQREHSKAVENLEAAGW